MLKNPLNQKIMTHKPSPITRQYFGTDGIRGRVGTSHVNPEFILKLGWAVGRVLAREGNSKVLIGKDTRISGYMFESALEAGLSAAGVDIHLLGPMPTPAIAYLTRTLRAQVGIVISASHNPYYDNGIKFFSQLGTKLPDDIELLIEAELNQPLVTVDSSRLGKAYRMIDAPGRYIEYCKGTVSQDITLQGLKIVVDCANGATYHIAPSVFRELGAEVIELSVEPDGLNINAACGATAPEALREAVLKYGADLGIALDGDGDRVIMVDEGGHIHDGDTLLYIIMKYRLTHKKLMGGVVGTVMSNYGLEQACSALKVPFKRASVGDRYVLEMLQDMQWVLGGESSGHIICRDFTTTGDGIIAALQVLVAMYRAGLPLSALSGELKKYPQVLINVKVENADTLFTNAAISKSVKDAEKALQNKGRVLLRKSGTEALVRVMVEGSDANQVETLAKFIAEVVTKEIG